MKKLIILIVLIFVGVLAWRVGDLVSRDVITMSIGVLFGVLAGIPAALLMLASSRRQQDRAEAMPPRRMDDPYARQQGQAPIIIMGGGGYPAQPQAPHAPQLPPWPTGGGQYKMLGGQQDERFRDDDTRRRWEDQA